ncbi:hypothetical protein, partial [Microcoleus sp. CAWBG52]|uniref:hypothetical protein n=1 Tax=Microcoleus sp. CAWBG52 TaxID=2841649 RepID=UPI0025D22FB2
PRASPLALWDFRRFLPILIRERWVFFHASGDARTVGFPAIFANFDPRAMGIFPRERWVFFHASGDARTVGFPAIFANFDPRAGAILSRERGRSHCGISGNFCQF